MNQDKIKMREKLSFAMANFGNIPIMTLINGYLLIFYTNICSDFCRFVKQADRDR